MTKPYRKIFVQNPSFKIDREPLEAMCDELVTVCERPMFDELADPTPDNRKQFEHAIERKLDDFDAETDAVAIYGDPLILAMMIQYLCLITAKVIVLRYSAKQGIYVSRLLSEEFYDADAHV